MRALPEKTKLLEEPKPVMGKRQYRVIVVVLGALSAIGPFSTDMYLPGFPSIASGLSTDIATVGLTLTSYFVGISLGQLACGPVMDRYGRKGPFIVGLLTYILAALGCAVAPSISALVVLRFFLALGGCVGMAGSRAVVRDLFSGTEMARVLSTLVMVFGVAPIIAPTIVVVITTMVINTLKIFDIVYVMTGGQFGTDVIAVRMYREMYNFFNVGHGTAVAVVLVVVIIPFIYLNIKRFMEQEAMR